MTALLAAWRAVGRTGRALLATEIDVSKWTAAAAAATGCSPRRRLPARMLTRVTLSTVVATLAAMVLRYDICTPSVKVRGVKPVSLVAMTTTALPHRMHCAR